MQRVNSGPSEAWSWAVVLTASLLFFYNYLLLAMFSTFARELMTTFELNAMQFGSLSAKYFIGNIIFLLPAGLILDKFSVRKVLLGAMLLCIISAFGFAWSHDLFMVKVMRFLTGVAAAFAFLGCVRLAAHWFPSQKLVMVGGCVMAMAMLGGMAGQAPLMFMLHGLSWRYTLVVVGFVGIGIFMAMWFVVQDWPPHCEQNKPCAVRQALWVKMGLWKGFRAVAFNKYNWLGGLFAAGMYLPIVLLGALWGTVYLIYAHGMSEIQASVINAMIFLGFIVGAPVMERISNILENRVLPMLVSGVAALFIVLMIMYMIGTSFVALLVFFFLLGLVAGAQALSYPVVTELNAPVLTSAALSVVSLLVVLGGLFCQPFFGWLMDLHWDLQIVNGEPIYSAQNYQLAMFVLPGAYIVSIVAAFLLKETYCKPRVEK